MKLVGLLFALMCVAVTAPTEEFVDRDLYSVNEAMVRLNIGRTRLYELVNSGQLETVLVGRNRRVPADAIAKYIDSLRSDG